jgi:hypothetical protein
MRAEARFKNLSHAEKARYIEARESYQEGPFAPGLLDAVNADISGS